MENEVKLIFEDGKIIKVEKGIKVSKLLNNEFDKNIIGLRVNGKAVSTDFEIYEDSLIEPIDISSRIGRKIYIKGLEFLYLLAIQELYKDYTKVNIKHSLDKAIYTELDFKKTITEKTALEIKKKMKKLVKDDLPINKISITKEDMIEYLEKQKEYEKVNNLKYLTVDVVTEYELKDMYNYFYYIMPASTKILDKFDLTFIPPKGIVLSYPINGEIPKYNSTEKVLNAFKDYQSKLSKVGINYASDINELVVNGKINDYIQMDEMMYQDDINKIVSKVVNNKKIKAIFISGPSSSGKTTTSKKLSLTLKSKGIDNILISTDDYYVNRELSPVDENGEYDFEVIECLDIKLFNRDLKKLLNYEEIKMPNYNFITGEREYKRPSVKLKKDQIIIVEGLHAINPKMSSDIDEKNKLKIYISPFTPVSIDRHNHISTTDLRLIRRMVRDYRTRGYTASATLDKWIKMRKSEEKNIYPYQRQANIILNTSLAYEIGVLKTYVEPLLYSIESNDENYEEAVRILNFLKGFLNIASEYVPNTSILREFIGSSYFE